MTCTAVPALPILISPPSCVGASCLDVTHNTVGKTITVRIAGSPLPTGWTAGDYVLPYFGAGGGSILWRLTVGSGYIQAVSKTGGGAGFSLVRTSGSGDLFVIQSVLAYPKDCLREFVEYTADDFNPPMSLNGQTFKVVAVSA